MGKLVPVNNVSSLAAAITDTKRHSILLASAVSTNITHAYKETTDSSTVKLVSPTNTYSVANTGDWGAYIGTGQSIYIYITGSNQWGEQHEDTTLFRSPPKQPQYKYAILPSSTIHIPRIVDRFGRILARQLGTLCDKPCNRRNDVPDSKFIYSGANTARLRYSRNDIIRPIEGGMLCAA